jgi:hypothetical protein
VPTITVAKFRPRQRGVEHLAAQGQGGDGRVRDDHRDRELDPLAAVDRARVREPQAFDSSGGIAEEGVLGPERQ